MALTRAVDVFRLYTDNTEALLKTIEQNHGVKRSSLEVIVEYPPPQSKVSKNSPQRQESIFSQAFGSKNPRKLAKHQDIAPRFTRDTLGRIKIGLNQNAEQIATEFLGSPIERGGHYLKFGSKQGSLSVTIKGDKQGWFNDFETNTGGRDMLRFVQLYGGMDRQQAVQYGAKWLGILSDNQTHSPKTKAIDHPQKNVLAGEDKAPPLSDYEKRRIKYANQLAKESVSIQGTLAEKYLREHRKIDTHSLPEDLRFHPGIHAKQNQKSLPALLSIARTFDGKIQSVEAIFLDEKTADKADTILKKQTIGPKKGLVIQIHKAKNKDAPTLIAEGVVTGLSLANALPKVNVVVVLGKQMFASVDPSMLSRKVIFCLDNDGKNVRTDQAILTAANRLQANEKSVSFMVPNGLTLPKQDYNDILKQLGKNVIKQDFHHAISYENFYHPSEVAAHKKSNNLSPPTQLSDKKIEQFVQQTQLESSQNNKANLRAYQSIRPTDQQHEITKPRVPTKDFEREI